MALETLKDVEKSYLGKSWENIHMEKSDMGLSEDLHKSWNDNWWKWSNEVYDKVKDIEPEMHVSSGMTRKCELDLIEFASKRHSVYIEIGCGEGHSLLRVKKNDVMAFGFDHVVETLDGVGTSYINCEIFDGFEISEKFKQEFRGLLDSREFGETFMIYCDNGWKVKELEYIAPLLMPGDVLGTHDIPTEVPDDFNPGPDYERMVCYEEFIERYACLQRFWMKLSPDRFLR